MNNLLRYHTLFILVILLFACGNSNESKTNLKIATSANMQYAMNDIVAAFEQKTGVKCEVIIASSGKLTAQINEGAPYDVFVSADMKYPNLIYRNGKALGAPKKYAEGKLVVWSNRISKLDSNLFVNNTIQHIAIANPETAPYGFAAKEFLSNKKLFQMLSPKFVFGESISQTNQFIISGAVDYGFTAKSVVMSPKMKGKGKWMEVDSKYYHPIDQGVVLLKNNNGNSLNAEKFFNFLFSTEAKQILVKYGYTVHE